VEGTSKGGSPEGHKRKREKAPLSWGITAKIGADALLIYGPSEKKNTKRGGKREVETAVKQRQFILSIFSRNAT